MTENMSRQESFDTARESFFAAEKHSQRVVEALRADGSDAVELELAEAVNSISYGLKILAAALQGDPRD